MSVGTSSLIKGDQEVERNNNSIKMMSKTRALCTQRYFQNFIPYAKSQSVQFSNVCATSQAPLIQQLPNLPVPKLNQTFEKYLRSVEPFLTPAELKNTESIVNNFQNGIGAKLQQLLVEKAKETDNWLADWWLSVAYLEYRDPVVVYSSPGLVFPCEDFQNEDDRLAYTSKLILAALDYKKLIDDRKMPLEKMGKDPLDMNQYNKIFGTCRLPGVKRDGLEFNPQSRHIVVARNNQFFKLEVINEGGQFPSVQELICNLQLILEQSEEMGAPIGILTTDNRNNWGKAYQYLTLDLENLRSAREIQTSLFLVCLDNPMPKYDENLRTTASHQLIHGGGSCGNSANRWFDKTVQFVIGEDGIVGLTYEHSPSEGQPIAVMADYLVNYIKSETWNKYGDTKFDLEPIRLNFKVDDRLQKYITRSNLNLDKLINNLDLDCFQFDLFGKEFVKAQKLSPDSFIQMAMQFAFYRIHQEPAAHYESAATRKYIDGRTETIRSCSNESVAFAKAMLDCAKSPQEKVEALKAAINSHKKYSVEAVNGFGVDRHLLGLKLTAVENGLEVPEIFKDVAFTKSTHMRISSSQVATKCDGFMAYGPLVPDGYGCCYNPRPEDINIGVSAFTEHPHTSATKFRQALTECLKDMHDILACTQKSKL